MPTLLLIRHGRTAANASGRLAGHLPGIALDDEGRAQADRLAERLGALPVCRVVSSPLQRTVETAEPLARALGQQLVTEEDLGECKYGAWTGRELKELAKEELWQTVQRAPSAAVFPESPEHEHESLAQMSARAVAAIRRQDALVRAEHGPAAVWLAVSHGDVIKAVLADALGAHLDEFQRIHVDPASVSVVRYTAGRPLVLAVNGSGADLTALVTPPEPDSEDGAVGGGAGAAAAGEPVPDDRPTADAAAGEARVRVGE